MDLSTKKFARLKMRAVKQEGLLTAEQALDWLKESYKPSIENTPYFELLNAIRGLCYQNGYEVSNDELIETLDYWFNN